MSSRIFNSHDNSTSACPSLGETLESAVSGINPVVTTKNLHNIQYETFDDPKSLLIVLYVTTVLITASLIPDDSSAGVM